MSDYGQQLAMTPLGKELGQADAAALAAVMTPVHGKQGEALFEKGAAADALYVVLQGAFSVMIDVELSVAILGPGSVVGELEVMTGGLRMASVVATEESTCLRLSAAILREKPVEHAAILSRLVDIIAKVLAVRLAAVNEKLAAAWCLATKASEENAGEVIESVREVLDDVWRW